MQHVSTLCGVWMPGGGLSPQSTCSTLAVCLLLQTHRRRHPCPFMHQAQTCRISALARGPGLSRIPLLDEPQSQAIGR